MPRRSEGYPGGRRARTGGSARSRKRALPWLDALEARELLASTPVLAVGDATIFTQLPPAPEGTTRPLVTPSDQPAIQSNILGGPFGGPIDAHTPPDIAPNSPAASKPVPSNQTWSTMLTRNPNQPAYLTNRQAYVLVDANGSPITAGNGTPVSYADYYAKLGQAPPAPDAPFFGRTIQATTANGVTTYAYALDKTGAIAPAGRIGFPYAPNASNPNSFGALSFSTNLTLNNNPDTATNFGLANSPFPSTPGTLFTLTSTARYLDYRAGRGNPNGNEAVTVQVETAPGQFQTVASNGLISYFNYDLPASNDATNSFSSPNFGDLGISMMDLGAPSTGPFADPRGIDANNVQLWDYSDYAATFTWGDPSLGRFYATMSSASPFTQFTYTRGTDAGPMTLLLRNNDIPGLNAPIDTATYDPDLNAILITGYARPDTSGMKVVQDPNVLVKVFYAVYLPSGLGIDAGSVQSSSDGLDFLPGNNPRQVPLFGIGANNVYVTVPGGSGTAANPFHFVVAALPDDSKATVQRFRDFAFNYVTGTTGEFAYDPATSGVGVTLNVTTQNVDPASTQPGALLTVYPLQYDHLDAATYNASYLLDPSLPAGSFLTLSTTFGPTRLMAAPTTGGANGPRTSTIGYSLSYDGSLSILPKGAFVSTDPNDVPSATKAELDQEIGLVRGLLTNLNATGFLTNNGLGDTYVWGQELNKLAALVPIADGLGLGAERDMLLALIKSELTQWFTASKTLNADGPGQVLGYDPHFGVPQFLYYDNTWDALIGYYAGHLADLGLNDFMYQWGYWIKAASIVATYDPSFVAGYGPIVTMLVRNVDNWDRGDTMFPYLRTFDAYAGHSWASGVVPVGDGQNEESISEAINFDSAMIDWGNVLIAGAKAQDPSDPGYALGLKIRNTGIALQTFETEAYREYYLNSHKNTFPPLTIVTYGGHTYAAAGYIQRETYEAHPDDYTQWKPEIYASNQFLLKRGTQTFFVSDDKTTGNNAESHYAISILPFSPSSLYLGADTALVEANYNRYLAQQDAVYGAPVPGQARALPIAFFSELLSYQALVDPAGALGRWNGVGNFRYHYPAGTDPATLAKDNFTTYSFQPTLDTPAATYYYLQFFNKYGEVNASVRGLNATATAVLDKAPSGASATYDRTYIVENLLSTPLAGVAFSDGYTVPNVPARSVYALTVKRSSPGGPVVGTVSNTDAIPDLSKAPAGPPQGGGTNLFLGYSAPTTPQAAAIEPLTLQPQTNPGLVAVTYYAKDPENKVFQYTNGTPYVVDPKGFFPGSALPSTNIVSFQIKDLNGTYDPALDTHFQLYFKAPFGLDKTDLQVAVQVRYDNKLADGTVGSYVLTYPKVSIANIGGVVVLTDPTLGVIGAVGPLGSGVAAATHTVGSGQLDPNLHFEVFQPDGGQNTNLVYPGYDANNPDPPLLDRAAQLSATPFRLTNGTVTFTVFIARFNNNNPDAQFADPELQFVAGLPGYAGLRSFVTIPFNDVSATPPVTSEPPPGPAATVTHLVSPVAHAIVDAGISVVSMAATVTANGRPVEEGTVQFFENGTVSLGFAPVIHGRASLVLRQGLLAGFDTITAVYAGPADRLAPSASEPVTVEVDTVKQDRNGLAITTPDGRTRMDLVPYGPQYRKGVNLAGLELGDGADPELFVAPRGGRAPIVKRYSGVTGALLGSFLAYRPGYRGAVSIAAANVNGGVIVTAPGGGRGARVKVFDAISGRRLLAFDAFRPRFRRGTTVSTTTNADGTGFTITARTKLGSKTYTSTFDGLSGSRIGAPVVVQAKRR